jgi:hypothetical protein
LHGGTEVKGAVHASVRLVVVTPLAFNPVGALSTPLQLSVDELEDDVFDEDEDNGRLLDDDDLIEDTIELEVATDEEDFIDDDVVTEDDVGAAEEVVVEDLLDELNAELDILTDELEDAAIEDDDAIIEDEEAVVPPFPNT